MTNPVAQVTERIAGALAAQAAVSAAAKAAAEQAHADQAASGPSPETASETP